MRHAKLALAFVAVVVVAGVAMFPVRDAAPANAPKKTVDLSAFSDAPPTAPVDLLFIHHSCGGQWLAEAGREDGVRAPCIARHHPNGGDLRERLRENHYVVHEASYGSRIGEKTDLFDWLPKFRDHMDEILAVEENDRFMNDGRTNRVVVFKSCFPNNDFVGRGAAPGNPSGPDLTLANARATMSALLPELAKRPDVLFVYVTAPPLAGDSTRPAWKYALRSLAQRPDSGALAREFDDWMISPDGWLSHYASSNVVVFDYFDILTGHGQSNRLVYPSGKYDSHPTSAGNTEATKAFVPFLNRALHRAGVDAITTN